MRVAIISDIHWGVRANSDYFLNIQEKFWYGEFFPYLEKEGIKTVWFLR